MNQTRVMIILVVLCSACGGGAGTGRRALFPPLALVAAEPLPPVLPPSSSGTELACKKRVVEARVHREDAQGRRCSGTVSMTVCAGRCDSQEVAEWRFPWKKWKHPVCGFGARTLSVALLEDCEEGASQEARVMPIVKAASCMCRPCQAASTSCLPLTTPPQPYHVDIPLPDVDSI